MKSIKWILSVTSVVLLACLAYFSLGKHENHSFIVSHLDFQPSLLEADVDTTVVVVMLPEFNPESAWLKNAIEQNPERFKEGIGKKKEKMRILWLAFSDWSEPHVGKYLAKGKTKEPFVIVHDSPDTYFVLRTSTRFIAEMLKQEYQHRKEEHK